VLVRLTPLEIGRAMRWAGAAGIVAGFLSAALCRLAEVGPLAEFVLTVCTSYAVATLLVHRAAWRGANGIR